MIVARVRHPERFQYAFGQNSFVSFPGDLFDNCPKQRISRIVIRELRSGLELEIAACKFLYEIRNVVTIAAEFGKIRPVRITRDAGGVI